MALKTAMNIDIVKMMQVSLLEIHKHAFALS